MIQPLDYSENLATILILASGYGSRWGEVTKHIPKCLLMIDGENRIIDHLIQRFALIHKRIYITVAYQKEIIIAYVNSRYKQPKYDIVFIEESHPSGSGNSFKVGVQEIVRENDAIKRIPLISCFSDVVVQDTIHWEPMKRAVVTTDEKLIVPTKKVFHSGMLIDNKKKAKEGQFFGMFKAESAKDVYNFASDSAGDQQWGDEWYEKLLPKYMKKKSEIKVSSILDFGEYISE